MKLSEAYVWILKVAPFSGPKPGSNFWPYLMIEDRADRVDEDDRAGEKIEDLVRAGYLTATKHPEDRIRIINEDSAIDPDLPPIELDHDYHLTPAGANAVAMFEAGLK